MVGFVGTGCALGGDKGQVASPDISAPAPQPAPERPRELAVVNRQSADICGLLTPEQQTQVGVGRSGPTAPGEAPGCVWLSVPGAEPDISVEIEALSKGIEGAYDRSDEPFPDMAASYAIAGVPAKQGQGSAGLEALGCRVDVDVAEGETLEVFYSPTLTGTVSNQDMCARAKQAAEFAVSNLQARGCAQFRDVVMWKVVGAGPGGVGNGEDATGCARRSRLRRWSGPVRVVAVRSV
ncbi:DUF3558 domain-containing protein [Saccharopolyspora sp. 6V]|uniref:DUF3558 domain-containing protein n=2 Tax=unclassified Saccharopolyspora TaxID=2646250 RepID=UPI001CD62D8C|nr:DUF3558 domain-containing protein [Saccharopolyspora sp. 6T]MCA1188890.1 DUF3558 domain-containing protein [Saccharopolyspora sp. 6T]MCA1195447.1 DUF3558 domain-containing protein [Saccharopolyspora sp. 6V]MCA1279813.1 DUF3558 domain-containing protein [Saccharopolyspora sp. 7B]